MLTSTRLQAATYLLCVCLFSISFLVFLNSSVSFVITDLIGVKDGVGDLVGTLGFADEIVALVACPLWGVLSDRVGVRTVCVLGYGIVGVALFLFVQARNVYPQLLLGRLFFSVGGAATSTMLTAILPAMTAPPPPSASPPSPPAQDAPPSSAAGHSTSPSLCSELTITPARFASPAERKPAVVLGKSQKPYPARLAGIVGTFTGCGALIALGVFLPLPTRFAAIEGVSSAQAVADSYYLVGSIALVIAVCCFFGLRGLRGEEGKGWRALVGKQSWYSGVQAEGSGARHTTHAASPASYRKALSSSISLAFQDVDIGLGYLGGFVARASSVGISLFIPLFVNAYFITSGLCDNDPSKGTAEMKEECRRAYVLAAKLTGVSQLVALLTAPLFGYLSDRYRRFNIPLLTSSLLGIIAYVSFALVQSPESSGAQGGSPLIFVLVALIGISQIGAIVCSLGLIARGVLGGEEDQDAPNVPTAQEPSEEDGLREDGQPATSAHGANAQASHRTVRPSMRPDQQQQRRHQSDETAPLIATNGSANLSSQTGPPERSRSSLKGSIAGVYSLSGGAGILLLTKLGGYLFDTLSPGAPFIMLAIFNALLLVVGITTGVGVEIRRKRRRAVRGVPDDGAG